MIIQNDYNEKELKRIARLSGSKQAEKDAHIVGYLGYKEPQKMYCEYIGGGSFYRWDDWKESTSHIWNCSRRIV